MPQLAPLQDRHRVSLEAVLGPDLQVFLRDPAILEILLDSDGTVWLDSHSLGLHPAELELAPHRSETLLTTIAGILGHELTASQPVLEAELPFDGSRISAFIPPVVSAPAFAIRKRAASIYTLADYVEAGILLPWVAELLRGSVSPVCADKRPLNVVIAGGPGSGKTTLANALLHEIARAPWGIQRLVLIEDTYELQCEAPCQQTLRTTDALGLRFLVQRALRLRPDRLIIGEVRGAEALDLLKAWNTGVPGGLATVHANSAEDALDRLDHLAQEAGLRSAARLVGCTVDLVAFLVRTPAGRRVTELVHVHGPGRGGGYDITACLEDST